MTTTNNLCVCLGVWLWLGGSLMSCPGGWRMGWRVILESSRGGGMVVAVLVGLLR